MNILLDTQITIWAFTNDKRLSSKAREIMLSPYNILFFSSASVIEVDWKTKSKNNNLEFNTAEYLDICYDAGYIQFPIMGEHIATANHLIWDGEGPEHKDPFDRMLLAQAMTEGMKFMTHDEKIAMFRQDCVILV